MDAKPFEVARVTHKVSYKNEGHFVVQFKVGKREQIGSVVLEMDTETAEEFKQGDEFVLYLERVVKSGPT